MKKNTTQDKIINLLTKKHLMSIAEIHKIINNVDYTTVYRNIEILLKNNKLRRIIFGKEFKYELNHDDKHSHFICDDCGDISSVSINTQDIKIKKGSKIS